ncbi:hypothetical protein PG984_011844 [Apiospora sp. TS-2023a]
MDSLPTYLAALMNFLIISLPALKMFGFVVALMCAEAFTRPLWMCRHPEIQARYTTAVFLGLMSIVYVLWLCVSHILDSYELLPKTIYRNFLWCTHWLFEVTFVLNIVRFCFPTALPLVFPHVFPIPAVTLQEGYMLHLNSPYTFWCSRLHPCVGFSRRTLHTRGEVKIERTTPGLDEVPDFSRPDSAVDCTGMNGPESSSGNTPESSDRTSQAHTAVDSNSSSSRVSTPSPPPRVLAPVPVRPVNFQEVARRVEEAESTYLRNMASSSPDH